MIKVFRNFNESSSGWGIGDSTWGTSGSVLPFTKWNNMTQTLYPNKENPTDDTYNWFKNKLGMAKDLYREFGYNRKRKISNKNEKP